MVHSCSSVCVGCTEVRCVYFRNDANDPFLSQVCWSFPSSKGGFTFLQSLALAVDCLLWRLDQSVTCTVGVQSPLYCWWLSNRWMWHSLPGLFTTRHWGCICLVCFLNSTTAPRVSTSKDTGSRREGGASCALTISACLPCAEDCPRNELRVRVWYCIS